MPVNGSIEKRFESGMIKLQKDAAAIDHSTRNGSFNKDDYHNNRTTGPYFRSNKVLMKNRSYNSEYGFSSRKYSDDVPKRRDDSFDSRSMYYYNYRNGEYF